MVFAIVLATVGTLAFAPAGKRPWRAVLGAGAATAVGLFIVPGLVAWFFVAHDAVEPFLYGTVWHNLVPDLDAKVARSVRMTGLAVVPVALLGAHGVVNNAAATRLGLRRAFLVLVTAGYVALLWGAWPIVTRQDMLPVFPLVAILLTAVLIELPVSAGGLPSAILPAVAAVEILVLSLNPKVRVAEAQATSGLMADMLRLVPPGESVFDPKGDVVFRPRATYWVFESLTRARVRMGLIGDDFAKSLLRTRTCVVTGSHYLPPRTREWVQAHYLRATRYPGAGSVLVAGARFDPISESFDVGIPTVYALVGATDVPRGLLDGRPYDGPRMLTTGRHTYRGSAGEGRIALLWAPAVEQAFSPFDAQGNWR